ncbi:MAG: hypothetical protein GY822_22210 [Deltaproteobacteria bacterium]|nr:hypothetical protein [Deltaproteobacteria bacterium]
MIKKTIRQNRPKIFLPSRFLPVFSCLALVFSAACTDGNEILVKEEATSLQKSVAILKDIQGRTTKALADKMHEAEFKKIRWLMLEEAKGALKAPRDDVTGWKFTNEKPGVMNAEKADGKLSDVAALFDAMSKEGQHAFVNSIDVDDKGAKVQFNRWLTGFPDRKFYLRGDLPTFEEIKLGRDLQKYRINPKHVVQPANEALKKQADDAYLALKADQEKLILQGHSQVVGNMLALLQRLQGSPASLKSAKQILELVASDATSLKVVANDRGLLMERSITDDKGASLQKIASEQGYFLDQLQVAETLRFLVVRKEYPPVNLSDVKAPASLDFVK